MVGSSFLVLFPYFSKDESFNCSINYFYSNIYYMSSLCFWKHSDLDIQQTYYFDYYWMTCNFISVLWLNLHPVFPPWTFPFGLSCYKYLKCFPNNVDNLKMKIQNVVIHLDESYTNLLKLHSPSLLPVKMILISVMLSL